MIVKKQMVPSPVAQILPTADIARLRGAIHGEMILPGDADYDTARHMHNLLHDEHPALIVRPVDTDDVVQAVTFALAMSALPNVTLVGEPTNGIFSDTWFVILPNGWLATLSNERYLSNEGVLYEGTGVTPDLEILMTAEGVAAGTDAIIEAVLELAQ